MKILTQRHKVKDVKIIKKRLFAPLLLCAFASKSPIMVLGLLDNLFFKAKINEAGKQAGVQISYAKDADKALDVIRESKPELIILDLDAAGCRPMELLSKLKADEQLKDIPTIGFVAHVHANVQKDADDAGCDRILARSTFERVLIATLQELKK